MYLHILSLTQNLSGIVPLWFYHFSYTILQVIFLSGEISIFMLLRVCPPKLWFTSFQDCYKFHMQTHYDILAAQEMCWISTAWLHLSCPSFHRSTPTSLLVMFSARINQGLIIMLIEVYILKPDVTPAIQIFTMQNDMFNFSYVSSLGQHASSLGKELIQL